MAALSRIARGAVVVVLVLVGAAAAAPPKTKPPQTPEVPAASPPPKKTKPAQDPDIAAVIALEQKLWLAWKAHDLASIRKLSVPEYYSVSEDGPEKAVTLEDIAANFKAYRLREFTFGRMAARKVGPDTVIVSYNAHIKGTFDGEDVSRDVADASVWVRREGRWLNAFLHEITLPAQKH